MNGDCLDDFEDLSAWTAIASGQARLAISPERGPEGAAMRLDFDFQGGGGFVVARKLFPLSLPESYAFSFDIRGRGPSNILEFKLVDASNQNVWRWRVEAFDFPGDWQRLRIKSSEIQFAWGPLGGGPARDIAAIELVIAAGPGGQGSVWIEGLRFEDTSYYLTPLVEATSALPGCEAFHVCDRSPATCWRSAAKDEPQRLVIDFQCEREYGGLVIRWDPDLRPQACEIRLSCDGNGWQTCFLADQGVGEETAVYLPGAASRFICLELRGGVPHQGFGILCVEVQPHDFSRSINDFFSTIAQRVRAGVYPKYLIGRQTYWTPVGTGEDVTQALFNEEGMVEVDQGTFSIEPFLFVDGRLVTWADVALTQSLELGYLPIPSSAWRAGDLSLSTTAFATGPSGASTLFIRYRLTNDSDGARQVRLFAAIRPFQVTPTWQHWQRFGGVSRIGELVYESGTLWVDGRKQVIPLTAPNGFGAATFAQGGIMEYLKTGDLPSQDRVQDAFGYASGALCFDLEIPPRSAREVHLAIPFGDDCRADARRAIRHPAVPVGNDCRADARRAIRHPEAPLGSEQGRADAQRAIRHPAVPLGGEEGRADAQRAIWHPLSDLQMAEPPSEFRPTEEFDRALTDWKARLGSLEIQLPRSAAGVVETLKTAAAHILINRDGPALHPGPRRYSRSWIRDGALMGAALARVGLPTAGRDFTRWYAGFQAPDGNLPDCADRDGCEWLPEFDSWGELIFAVMDHYRFSGDSQGPLPAPLGYWPSLAKREFLAQMWPAVLKSVNYLETLRNQRLTAEYQTPERRACYGLLPESMSHEGYMAHPVHAYWDDFWALRGFKDAAEMAEILGDVLQAERIAALADGFQGTLYASLALVIRDRGLDFVPGSVEFADFDPSATSIAVVLADELHRLPRPAIDQTFDKYLEGFRARVRGDTPWANYSAYEIRIIGALVRLGRRQEAHELLRFFLADRRILPWNQWPEISWRDPLGPSFIGDMPHSWIGAEYILAVRSLFAYEREADQSLVVAAGVAAEWLDEGHEVMVRDLPTYFGRLSYRMRREGPDTLRVVLSGDLVIPPGRILLMPPLPRPLVAVEVNGRSGDLFQPDGFACGECPADILLRY